MTIHSKDISVVVQGNTTGTPEDPLEQQWTRRCLESLRQHLPDAELILSTYTDCDVRALNCDILVQSEDPGFLDLQPLNNNQGNTNRQVITTQAGLAKATRSYAIKMRCDLVLQGADFLATFDAFPERAAAWRATKQRIICANAFCYDPTKLHQTAFMINDWFQFGLAEDLHTLWDLPLIPALELVEPDQPNLLERYRYIPAQRYTAEQYLWLNCLRKQGEIAFRDTHSFSDEIQNISEIALANNFIVLEMDQFPMECLKYPGLNQAIFSKTGLYSHADWLELYARHCSDGPIVKLNPDSKSPHDALQAHPDVDSVIAAITQDIKDVDFSDLQRRLSPSIIQHLHRSAGANEGLLRSAVNVLQPRVLVEVGIGNGLRTLSMKPRMPTPSVYIAINHNHHDFKGPNNTLLTPLEKSEQSYQQLDVDLSLPLRRQLLFECTKNANLIVINIRDGHMLQAILDGLYQQPLRIGRWIILTSIRHISVFPVWKAMELPRVDLTTHGHEEGIGLVYQPKREISA